MAGHQVRLAAFLIIYSFIHYLYLSTGSLATTCAHHRNDSIHPTPHNPRDARTTGRTETEPAQLGFRFHTPNRTLTQLARDLFYLGPPTYSTAMSIPPLTLSARPPPPVCPPGSIPSACARYWLLSCRDLRYHSIPVSRPPTTSNIPSPVFPTSKARSPLKNSAPYH